MFSSRQSPVSTLISTALSGLLLVVLVIAGLTIDVNRSLAAPQATIYVDGTLGNDANACTSAGAGACATIAGGVDRATDGDTIQVAAGTYVEHDIVIGKVVTVQGAGMESTIIDGNFAGRVLYSFNTVVIADLTIRNGKIVTTSTNVFDEGGAGLFSSGELTLQNVLITNNEAQGSGGGIFTNGQLTLINTQLISNTANGNGGGIYQWSLPSTTAITVSNSLISGNKAIALQGGGIYNTRQLLVEDSTITHNTAPNSGGGVLVGGTAELNRVTFTGNEAQAGAALMSQAGQGELTNVTISGNTATNNYGGIYLTGPSVVFTVTNSTIAYNDRSGSAGTAYNGIVVANNASVYIQNTLIAYNEGRNCLTSENFISLGHNLSSDSRCALTGTMDLPSTDPLLSVLGNYGGSTETHALGEGSPAIDAADNGSCPAIDQRGISRPVDGDSSGVATCDIGAFEVTPQLTIADLLITEGNSGSATAQFTVTLSPTSTETVTVYASTADGTAAAGSDYTAISNQLITFDPGEATQFVAVDVLGDLDDENDETFTVSLTNPTNAQIIDGEATGTIIDEDGLPSLTIGDVTIEEGNSGTKTAIFTVTLSPVAGDTVQVTVASAEDGATADEDFTSVNQLLTFTPGQSTQTVEVTIIGDVVDEGSGETFAMNLSGATNANIADGMAVGTIADDDLALLSHELGPQIIEGNSGTTTAYFTVTLSTPAAFVITVDYEISSGFGDNGAKIGSDITGTVSGTLTFNPGDTEKTYPVEIVGDTEREEDESFSSLLSNGTVSIQPNSSLATILNDDNYRVILPLIVK